MKLIKDNSYLLLVVVICIIFMVIGMEKFEDDVVYEKVIVSEGDTLWHYSTMYAQQMPKEKWIEGIVKVNNLSSTTIKVGQEIKIPQVENNRLPITAKKLAGVEK